MKILKSLIVIMVSLSMLFMTACEDEDVAIGTGLIIIGASKISKGSSRHQRFRRNHRRNLRRHHRPHRRSRRGTIHAHGTGSFYGASLGIQTESDLDVHKVSSEFHLDLDTAHDFASALEMSLDGDISGLEDIGFSGKDLKRLSKFKMPKSDSIQRIAFNLNQKPVHTKAMLQNLINGSKAQASDINSYLWQSCMAEGKWKTPQNSYCSRTSWNGCSPATGATACVPAKIDQAI